MTTVSLSGQLAAMSAAQFAALPPHVKLQYSAKMPNQFLMNHAVLSRRQAQRIGLATSTAAHVFQLAHTRVVQPTIAKRPLNSWMCFRSFYFLIFAPLQQKDASGYLTTLWLQDPFKAKWTIIARAYSAIRDKVGKPSAPLDRFLSLVCPHLGIIDSMQYLEKMCWTVDYELDGAMKLKQTSLPDIASFDDHIKHTIMTERDVIHFCAEKGYITRSIANDIAGRHQATSPNAPAASQQSLLATTPIVTAPQPTGINTFLVQIANNPRAAATEIFGFDIDTLLGPAEQSESANLPANLAADLLPGPKPYEWTGCMADLYNPDEGSFNFEALRNEYSTPLFETGDISDPQSFETIFGEVIQDGFYQPSVPEFGSCPLFD